MYVKCMQKSQNSLDSVGMTGLCGLRSVQNRPIRTLPGWLGQLLFFWGSRGREFESPQPDKNPLRRALCFFWSGALMCQIAADLTGSNVYSVESRKMNRRFAILE